ncbi:MAG TPA: 2OG-Fe(II) oxygenase, partial [Candidatus Thioglobus sp.]|nr:2OG-Fe(II) oxygenase [Candidatus Thioglobus sp.]
AVDKLSKKGNDSLNKTHESISIEELNTFRLEVIKEINEQSWLREAYYQIARPYLDILVGNELAMQLRVNLSIQMPEDDSSLLSVHADTWSGDSPYEVVVWLPLVDCYDTKSMYLLPPKVASKLTDNFKLHAQGDSEQLFNAIEGDVNWMKIDYGEVLVFNQIYPHGNRVNKESETRWSMNCRFKSLFSPYKDKKIGEFFEPITMRPVTKVSMDYKLPTL